MSRALHLIRVVGGCALLLALPSSAFAQQAETIEYYGTDAIGSIRIVWDANGTVTARMDYTPFGEPVLQQGTAIPKEGFGGNETDEETNQDYFHARMFEARTGRFTRTDPIEDGVGEPQRWNRYAYALNNPLTLVDPFGAYVDPRDCAEEHVHCPPPDDPGDPNDPTGGGGTSGPNGECPKFGAKPCAPPRDPPGGKKRPGPTTTPTDPPADPKCDPSKEKCKNDPPPCDPTKPGACNPSIPKAWWEGFLHGINHNPDYYDCLESDLIGGPTGPGGSHAIGLALTTGVENGSSELAGTYYHFVDGRFTAWGARSKVLVPRLAGTIETVAEFADGLGWLWFDAELTSAVSECSSLVK